MHNLISGNSRDVPAKYIYDRLTALVSSSHLCRGIRDVFVVESADVGNLTKLLIGHDNRFFSPPPPSKQLMPV